MSRHVVRARAGESRANLYDEITDKIITELEAGHVPCPVLGNIVGEGTPRHAQERFNGPAV